MSTPVEAADGRQLYSVVLEAFRTAGINYRSKNPNASLIWYDTIKDADYWSELKPFQVVNRIPAINVICRKAPFVRLIQRIQPYFPNLYTFLPKSYILPAQNHEFIKAVVRHDRKHIIKPDNGSLGAGITVLTPEMSYSPTTNLAIAQEYVESCLVDSTKFDCRIYVLIASVDPLKIYVYRGGIARFCSQKSDQNSIYSQLTNTAVNKNNPDVDISSITKMVTDTFEKLKANGVNVDELWSKIDSAVVSTIIAAYGYIHSAVQSQCPSLGYPKCFQILGFDVLIDEKYNPTILEVNFRPSLETDTPDERKMKCDMLTSAMKIAAPLNEVQRIVAMSKDGITDPNEWRRYVTSNIQLIADMTRRVATTEKIGNFVRVFPSKHPNYTQWLNALDRVKIMSTSYEQTSYKMPVSVTPPKDAPAWKSVLSVRISGAPVAKRDPEPLPETKKPEPVIVKPKTQPQPPAPKKIDVKVKLEPVVLKEEVQKPPVTEKSVTLLKSATKGKPVVKKPVVPARSVRIGK